MAKKCDNLVIADLTTGKNCFVLIEVSDRLEILTDNAVYWNENTENDPGTLIIRKRCENFDLYHEPTLAEVERAFTCK